MIEMSLRCYISKKKLFPFPCLNSYIIREEQEHHTPRAVGLRARDTELSEYQACVDVLMCVAPTTSERRQFGKSISYLLRSGPMQTQKV